MNTDLRPGSEQVQTSSIPRFSQRSDPPKPVLLRIQPWVQPLSHTQLKSEKEINIFALFANTHLHFMVHCKKDVHSHIGRLVKVKNTVYPYLLLGFAVFFLFTSVNILLSLYSSDLFRAAHVPRLLRVRPFLFKTKNTTFRQKSWFIHIKIKVSLVKTWKWKKKPRKKPCCCFT